MSWGGHSSVTRSGILGPWAAKTPNHPQRKPPLGTARILRSEKVQGFPKGGFCVIVVVRAPVAIINFASNPWKNLSVYIRFNKEAPHKKRKINGALATGARTTPIIEISPLTKTPFGNPQKVQNEESPTLSFFFLGLVENTKENPQEHQGFSSPCEPLKTLENKQKTPQKTKEIPSKKNTKETKTSRKRRTGDFFRIFDPNVAPKNAPKFPQLLEWFSCFLSWETETTRNSPKSPPFVNAS